MLALRGALQTDVEKALADFGYGVPTSGDYDEMTRHAVTAFQRRFRPAQIDGMADTSTRETLQKLLAARDNPDAKADRKPAAKL